MPRPLHILPYRYLICKSKLDWLLKLGEIWNNRLPFFSRFLYYNDFTHLLSFSKMLFRQASWVMRDPPHRVLKPPRTNAAPRTPLMGLAPKLIITARGSFSSLLFSFLPFPSLLWIHKICNFWNPHLNWNGLQLGGIFNLTYPGLPHKIVGRLDSREWFTLI